MMPFTSAGPLAASTPLEAAGLALSGVLPTTVPYWSAFVLISLPASGLVLLACSTATNDLGSVMRLVTTLLGLAATVALVITLIGSSAGLLGPGGWTTVVAAGLVALTLPSQLSREVRNIR